MAICLHVRHLRHLALKVLHAWKDDYVRGANRYLFFDPHSSLGLFFKNIDACVGLFTLFLAYTSPHLSFVVVFHSFGDDIPGMEGLGTGKYK